MTSPLHAIVLAGSLGMAGSLAWLPDALASHQVPGFEADASRVVAAITTKGVVGHMNELQRIADFYDGHRSAGSSGYAASVSYVQRRLVAAGYRPTVQAFTYPYFQERAKPVLASAGTSFRPGTDIETFQFSGSGALTGRLVAIDVQIPPPSTGSTTSGCEPADFPPAGAGPAIAVIQRGTCTFDDKAANAVAAGYDAVVIFNEGQEGRTDAAFGSLSEASAVPVLAASYATGRKLVGLAGKGASAQVDVRTRNETRRTYNILADTAGGDPDRTVVVGAHLDSVRTGPGINDNGSGSGAILELALQIARLKVQTANRVRFAWWGAEELGLFGSNHYVETLPEIQRRQLLAYLNFDMIASHNYVWMIQQGDPANPADAVVEQVFAKYFQRARLPYGTTPAAGNSDYFAFMEAGIPIGGLFSGASEIKTRRQAAAFGGQAGQALDHCYHRACDTNRFINRRSALVLGRAIADTVIKFAMTTRDLRAAPKAAAAPAPSSQALIQPVVQPASPQAHIMEYRGPFLVR